MDVLTDAVFQEQVADSILDDDNIVGDGQVHFADEEAPAPAPQTDHGQEIPDEFAQERELPDERQQRQADPREDQDQQQAERSPAEIEQGIQQLGEMVEQLGLNDQEAATNCAYELAAQFGSDPRSIDSQALGKTIGQVALSVEQIYESGVGNLGPVPPHAAQAFTSDFHQAFGIDSRTIQVDSQQFANVAMAAGLSLRAAVETFGANASLSRLNSPEACEWFANGLMQAYGKGPLSREDSIALADAFAKPLLRAWGKLEQAQPQPRQGHQSRQSQGSRSASSRKPGGRRGQSFKSNQDIFSPEVMDRIANERL